MPAENTHSAPSPATVTGDESAEPEPSGRWQLAAEIVRDDGDWDAFGSVESHIDRVITAVAARREMTDRPPALVTIVLSSNDAVRQLNHSFRGKDKPTNVLSFPAAPMPAIAADQPQLLGDVVLAENTLLSEATDAGISQVHHLQHLVLHGLLHLVGYDHETDDDAAVMEGLETAILADLGVPDPYPPLSEDEGQ